MTAESKARGKIKSLRILASDKGATPAERDTANRIADQIEAKHGFKGKSKQTYTTDELLEILMKNINSNQPPQDYAEQSRRDSEANQRTYRRSVVEDAARAWRDGNPSPFAGRAYAEWADGPIGYATGGQRATHRPSPRGPFHEGWADRRMAGDSWWTVCGGPNRPFGPYGPVERVERDRDYISGDWSFVWRCPRCSNSVRWKFSDTLVMQDQDMFVMELVDILDGYKSNLCGPCEDEHQRHERARWEQQIQEEEVARRRATYDTYSARMYVNDVHVADIKDVHTTGIPDIEVKEVFMGKDSAWNQFFSKFKKDKK